MTTFKNFLHDETGAVTIDWVALTAGILLLGIAVVFSIFSNGVDPLVDSINFQLDKASAGLCNDIATGGGAGSLQSDPNNGDNSQGIESDACTALSN